MELRSRGGSILQAERSLTATDSVRSCEVPTETHITSQKNAVLFHSSDESGHRFGHS